MKKQMFLVGLFILVLVFSSFGVAMSQRDRGVWKEIDAFVLQNLNTVKEPNGVNILTKMVLKRFGNELDAEIKTYGKELTPAQREQLKYLLVSDYISYLYQKSLIPKNAKKVIVKPIKVLSYKENGKVYNWYYAPLSSSIPYPIHWWVQVNVDINGGRGIDNRANPYSVDGKNDLFEIVVYYTSSSVQYELHFYDEDHPIPSVDSWYDDYRCEHYPGRDDTYGCEDIESIRVENGVIEFPTTWSRIYECHNNYCTWTEQTYGEPIPTHESGERTYSPSVVIYISNTWNHLMDTVDSNPSMSKKWWYTSWN
ncbi:MAG: hypothetical protein H0Z18_09225 [Thermococcus sp.]|uniref:hypothetical protein n=1 Tax=Thermococcus sp. TaxID=35749 RepID=UPI001DAD12B8|nr:hypothetical protein [Thermococcus sp.]MBO8175425.1 hypothetical protein [Thermococcus sp.]